MDVPEVSAGQRVLGVAIALPEPWASLVRLVRTSAGDPCGRSVPPHITLVPPTAVASGRIDEVVAHLSEVARGTGPFVVRLTGTGSFRPVTPVVYLCVVRGGHECDALQERVRTGVLQGPLRYPFHPHVTLAHEVDDHALDEAASAARDVDATFVVENLHLYGMAPDGSWEVLATPALAGRQDPVPVGGDGLPAARGAGVVSWT